jgi:hypothetical protein
MIINIRGTSGSGKSTLVKRIMDLYDKREPIFTDGRKRPLAYNLFKKKASASGNSPQKAVAGVLDESSEYDDRKQLFVPGHYEISCGGCDTLKTVDQVYDLVKHAAGEGISVLYEGIMVADDVTRAVALSKVHELHVVLLTTPVEECLRAIKDRRAEKGNTGPLESRTVNKTTVRSATHKRSMGRLQDSGVKTKWLGREEAFVYVRELLGV